ncbi:MAG: acetate--CoA ligase family protein [Desulfobacterales bacterium]|nr:acetate--CoA ligase family protein [Desulfobacterales bacterium]
MTGSELIGNIIERNIKSGATGLNEDQAKEIFRALELPVVGEEKVEAGGRDDYITEVLAAGDRTGYPLVLKGLGEKILHKTEAGLVITGIESRERLAQAAAIVKDRAGAELDAFLVQPMIQGKREFVAGMFRDAQFGPVIMFGLGGVLTEALEDIVFRIAPLSEADLEDMLNGLAAKKLLGPFRGEAAVDRDALKSVIKGLSDLACDYPAIREIDVNPLIVQPDGKPVAVDGPVILGEGGQAGECRPKIDFKALNLCFYPESIAFVGASASPGKWGHMLPVNTFARDFKGKVYLVNPKGGTIMGRKVYESLDRIEGDVDLAVVTVPAGRVMDLIPEMAEKNVKGMLLITSGFREVGEEGRQLEDAVMAKAREAGILVLGPNTMGVCNPHAEFYSTAANAYPLPGSTALVCQSGNMGTQLLAFAEQQDIGIRAFSGSGNEAMVTIEDYMEAFELDDLTRSVVLYIESVKDGRRFFQSASRVSRKKPVIVLKGGRTAMGEQAASSHTGAMASDAKVFNAACNQAGVIQVEQPMELLDLSAVFSSLPLPRGNRVAIMTLGGGWGVVTTDLCAEYGLEVPPLSEEIIGKLNGILPSFWSHGNPVDIVGEGDPNIPRTCIKELLKWDGCDAVIHLGIHGKRVLANAMIESTLRIDPAMDENSAVLYKDALLQFEEEYTRYVVELTQKYNKPVLGVSLLTDELSRTLYRFDNHEHKGVFFPSPERAVKALAGMVRYQTWLENRKA